MEEIIRELFSGNVRDIQKKYASMKGMFNPDSDYSKLIQNVFNSELKNIVEKDCSNIQWIDAQNQTVELCMMAINKQPRSIYLIHNQLPEFYLTAVKTHGTVFKNLQNKYKTPEMCLIAINQDGCNLEFVPDELKTLEICTIAVKHRGNTIKFVPAEHCIYNIRMAAKRQNPAID